MIQMPDQRDMKLPSVVSQKPVIAVWKLAGRRWFAHQLLVEAFGGFLLKSGQLPGHTGSGTEPYQTDRCLDLPYILA